MTAEQETTEEEARGPDAFWLSIIAEKDAEIARLRTEGVRLRAKLVHLAHEVEALKRGEDIARRMRDAALAGHHPR